MQFNCGLTPSPQIFQGFFAAGVFSLPHSVLSVAVTEFFRRTGDQDQDKKKSFESSFLLVTRKKRVIFPINASV